MQEDENLSEEERVEKAREVLAEANEALGNAVHAGWSNEWVCILLDPSNINIYILSLLGKHLQCLPRTLKNNKYSLFFLKLLYSGKLYF